MFYEPSGEVYRWQDMESEEGKRALRMLAPGKEGEPRRQVFLACPMCGRLDWCSSHEAMVETFEIAPPTFHDDNLCDRCQWVNQRHPELAAWVQRVIMNKQDRPRRWWSRTKRALLIVASNVVTATERTLVGPHKKHTARELIEPILDGEHDEE